MKNNKRLKAGLLAALMCIGVFSMSACAPKNNDAEGSKSSDDASVQSSEAESDSGEPSNTAGITFSFWGGANEKDAITQAVASYSKSSGIEVTPLYIPQDYDTKIATLIAANNSPDVAYMAPPLAYKSYSEGLLVNMMDLMSKDTGFSSDAFLDSAYVYYDAQQLIGILLAIESYGIYYNKDVFTAAGVDFPESDNTKAWTWDEFLETAKKLTLDSSGKNASDAGFNKDSITQYGFYMNYGWFGPLEQLLIRNNASYLSEDGTKFALNDDKAIDVFQKISDLINVHYVSPTPVAQKALPAANISLQSKKYAMVYDGQWACLDYGMMEGLNWGLAPAPKFENTKVIASSGLKVVFKSTKNEEGSWGLVKWISDPTNSMGLYKDGLWMPTMREWYEDAGKLEQWAAVSKSHPEEYKDVFLNPVLNESVLTDELSIINFGEINNLLFPALDKTWSGEQTAKQTIDEVTPKIQDLIKGKYGKDK